MQASRGWRSTKLHMALLVMALMTGVYIHAGTPDAQFGEYCLGLLGAAGIYSGASTAEKFVRPPPSA